MDKSFVISAAAVTNIGLVRSRNEDNLYFNGEILSEDDSDKSFKTLYAENISEPCVFAVCDGMGGLNNGGLASYSCVSAFEGCNKELEKSPDGQKCLLEIINNANSKLCDIMDADGKRMGSTVAAVAFAGGQLTAANVGDTRIYRMRKGELCQMSVDHNEAGYLVDHGMITVKQAAVHPGRNRLTQHIGIYPDEIVLYPHVVNHEDCEKGDIYIICSDGLYSLIDDDTIISEILAADSLTEAAKALSDAAVKAGGKDNITVILAKIDGEEQNGNAEERAEEEHGQEPPRPLSYYILKLFDIRKKGQKPYILTPHLIMSRLIFAVILLTAVMCVAMYLLSGAAF